MTISLIELTKKLINQPSITPKDHNCQNIIACYLKSLKFNIELMNFYDTHNIWAYRNGQHKQKQQHTTTLLFLGHTDVVSPGNTQNWKYPPFSGLINNGVLYGRGASDMKGALAAMLIAAQHFIQRHPNHKKKIAFLFTSDEEGSGKNGTIKAVQQLIERNEHIEYCIVGEPSSQNKLGDVIKNGRRGSCTGKLIIQGSSGHVAYPQFLINPIHLTIPMLFDLMNIKWDQKNSIIFPKTSIQITNINTVPANCTTHNITPDQLILNFNLRFSDQSSIKSIQNNINKILSMHSLNYHIYWDPCISEPYFSNPGKLTNVVTNIITKHYHYNIIPRLETTGGISDGRFIAKTGSEVLELGALNHTIHKFNEHIKLTDLKLLSYFYFKIMEKMLL
ncbi:succinyl-diaminopimelate desuccinylase [Candidatus Blochmanniella vafra str. BVAF]|uniref:Succinyl-diaminopimelate desuccinylase n=1 Tax=Blochmanniella vafra (strain BVAF) TaxID=859654 RepID=E8Q776_BLOVB|nr:succinyl-diaminopimelate desuccinylase [Candidatus Blochmannia vafer]ADV33900.1 succinyl-diaminopimelate desuccinylase [Candidatus Blochmannia vafer str. BVAF]